ncbi:calmodulin-lysine N-methyltransferase-like isoform X1 [Hetaerina americana]|uniref:calmodulin-lysine N-methyltransferase-like isoform X1 n=1 Tax=Hetaerina americana TaxID=62018 RepID=UPI003A7F5B29
MSALCNGSQLISQKGSGRNENARRRWKLLARVLQKRDCDWTTKDVSVRRISCFGLIIPCPIQECDQQYGESLWFGYSAVAANKFSVNIKHISQKISANDLMGFNNTGNVCVWPSEEVLAYYCLSNLDFFSGKSVIELGGGMTCLAGVMIAKYTTAPRVFLTDGNVISVNNVQHIINHNDFGSSVVTCAVLQWGVRMSYENAQSKYDIVLCADCLFFDDDRKDLIETIWTVLNENGVGLVMAPRRGDTLDKFLDEAKSKFHCTIDHCYNEHVWKRHLELKKHCEYDEDIHYPLLLQLRKIYTNGSCHSC